MPERVTLRPRDTAERLSPRNFLTVLCPRPTILAMAWTPGQRAAQQDLEAPFEDVPDHLVRPLWDWLETPLRAEPHLMHAAGLSFHVAVPGRSYTHQARLGHFEGLCYEDAHFTLNLIEFVLEHATQPDWRFLEAQLVMANSAYSVRADKRGLERRTIPAVRDHVQDVVRSATGSAGDHLATAWNSAFSRNPDPSKAYSEAIKAAEAALAPRVTPQNGKQTLGTMIKDVAQAPQNFTFAIGNGANSDGVGMVLAMMRQLWEGQTSRHGGVNPTRKETIEEVHAAISISAALVQWGVTGAFAHV